MFPKPTKYKINQQVWCRFDNEMVTVSTIKAIFIRSNGVIEYQIHGYEYCLSEDNISNSDKEPKVIRLITPPGC